MRKLLRKIKTYIVSVISLRVVKDKGKGIIVNHLCKFTKYTHIGTNCHFNGLIIQGLGNVYIGNNFHSGTGCLFITSNHNYDKGISIPYDNTYISKDIIIEDNVWIGSNVIILGGSLIEEGSIIQAGSVVVGKIDKYSIAGGHPAKTFKKRDIIHYENLKKEKKFF